MVARDLLAGNAIFLCSQNNFTLSLNLPHSTGLYLLPWIQWDLFVRGRNCHNTISFLVPDFPVFTVSFMCAFVCCQHFSRNFIWLLKLMIVWANGDLQANNKRWQMFCEPFFLTSGLQYQGQRPDLWRIRFSPSVTTPEGTSWTHSQVLHTVQGFNINTSFPS